MKLYICTRGHLPRIHTPGTGLTGKLETHWVTHTDAERGALLRHLGLSRRLVHCCNPPRFKHPPIAWMRNWVCENLAPRGRWMAWADDNIRRVVCVPPPHYKQERLDFDTDSAANWRILFHQEASPARIVALLEELTQKCEQEGTAYGGFAPEDNYYFRPRHWRVPTGYVKTKLAVYKNDGSTWYPFAGCMFEDFCKSVDVVTRYGCVVINNYARPENRYWEEGGIGSEESRRPHLLKNVAWLVKRYGGLVKRHPEVETNIQFALRTRRQVEQWREENGYAATTHAKTLATGYDHVTTRQTPGAAQRDPGRVSRRV